MLAIKGNNKDNYVLKQVPGEAPSPQPGPQPEVAGPSRWSGGESCRIFSGLSFAAANMF